MKAIRLLRGALIGGGALAAAVLSGSQAISNVLAKDDPVLAGTAFPLAAKADETMARALTSAGNSAEAQSFAMAAYRTNPLSGDALAVIAQQEMSRSDREAFMTAVAQVTKRGTLLQGALLAYHTTRGDIEASLRSLDRVARVYPRLSAAMTPVLADALNERGALPVFAQLLKQDPPWKDGFLLQAASKPSLLPKLKLLRQSLRNEVAIDQAVDARIMKALLDAGDSDGAYDIYQQLSDVPKAGAGSNQATLDWANIYAPFEWALSSNPKERAQISSDPSKIEVYIKRGNGGTIASRLLKTSQQISGLSISHELEVPGRKSEVRVRLVCKPGDRVLVDKPLNDSPVRIPVSTPATQCGLYELSLTGRAWSDEGDIEGQLDQITLDFQ